MTGHPQERREHDREHVQARGVEFANLVDDGAADRVRSDGRAAPVAVLKRDINRRPQQADGISPAGTSMRGSERTTVNGRRGRPITVSVKSQFHIGLLPSANEDQTTKRRRWPMPAPLPLFKLAAVLYFARPAARAGLCRLCRGTSYAFE